MNFKRNTRHLAAALVVCLALVAAVPFAAWADSYQRSGGQVTFTSDRVLESNLSKDALSDLQPGDDVTLAVTLSNQYAGDTDWYVSNEVVRAFEDSGATGAAYAYRLTYKAPNGTQTLVYDSSSVGGEGTSGLHGVSGLEDYIYLDTFTEGQQGSVTLYVAIDGESQGNAYMKALADLRLNFAVEVPEAGVREVTKTETVTKTVTEEASSNDSETRTVASVKTGDNMPLLPVFVVMAVSGTALLVLGLLRLRRGSRGGEQR